MCDNNNDTYVVNVENKNCDTNYELTGIFVGNFIRMAADSSSGDPRNVKNLSKKN